jgi:AcrR family transcriptional regulator
MTTSEPAPASRRSRGRAREEHIVDAATQLIAERGMAHVRMSDIAERAGVSTGHVTYYFPSKAELLMRAIGASEERLVAQVERSVLRVRDPWRRLARLVSMSASAGRADEGWVLWFQVWHEASLDPHVAAVQDALDARWRGILADVLRYGAGLGAFHAPDPEAAARVLSAVVDGLSIQVTLGAEDLHRDDMLTLFDRTARTLLAPPTDPRHDGDTSCS